jgi:hypothetical protein
VIAGHHDRDKIDSQRNQEKEFVLAADRWLPRVDRQ